MKIQTVLVGLIFITGLIKVVLSFTTPQPYPACDNSAAKHELAALYDNRRLLHAVSVATFRLQNDDFKGRHCTAIVKWADGSESQVGYEFYRAGRYTRNFSMWIDYNGGMRGPSL